MRRRFEEYSERRAIGVFCPYCADTPRSSDEPAAAGRALLRILDKMDEVWWSREWPIRVLWSLLAGFSIDPFLGTNWLRGAKVSTCGVLWSIEALRGVTCNLMMDLFRFFLDVDWNTFFFFGASPGLKRSDFQYPLRLPLNDWFSAEFGSLTSWNSRPMSIW